jgi:hypothetical protein
MSDADWLAHRDPLGPKSAGTSPELDALATYVLSLDHAPRSPFRNLDGSFSAQARRGRDAFAKAGCPRCHIPPSFTNSEAGDVFDVGTQHPTSGHRLGGDLVGLDTPSLKGLWQSAPYLHDGRAATLEEVFEITGDRMGTISTLSTGERRDLTRYLLELDDVPEPTDEHAGVSAGGGACSVAAVRGSTTPWSLGLMVVLVRFAGRRRRRARRVALARYPPVPVSTADSVILLDVAVAAEERIAEKPLANVEVSGDVNRRKA